MTVSVRLDDETRRLLTRLARSHRVPQSEIIRRAIRALAKSDPATEEVDVYGRMKHLVGSVRSGRSDLSQQTGEHFRQMLVEKKRKSRF